MSTYKILIVDDDTQSLQILNSYLSEINSSFNITKVSRSEKVLKLAKSKRPDLIITDWEMPVMDGLELTKSLKNEDITKDIPVIIITGIMLTSESIKNAFDAGATEYISKPFTKNELAARVKSVLAAREHIKQFKQLNNSKNKFCSNIANDLTSFFEELFSISGSIKDCISIDQNNKASELTDNLLKSSKLYYKSVQNLSVWSDFQQGILPFNPEKIKLKKLFTNAQEIFKQESIARNIVFDSECNDDLVVTADIKMLTIIINNLISNAFKYTKEKGHIILHAESKDDLVEIAVSDNGIGINSDKIEELFKFEFTDPTPGLNNEKGFGLGLTICKDFVEKNKGKIWVESRVKKGSKFHFTLPSA